MTIIDTAYTGGMEILRRPDTPVRLTFIIALLSLSAAGCLPGKKEKRPKPTDEPDRIVVMRGSAPSRDQEVRPGHKRLPPSSLDELLANLPILSQDQLVSIIANDQMLLDPESQQPLSRIVVDQGQVYVFLENATTQTRTWQWLETFFAQSDSYQIFVGDRNRFANIQQTWLSESAEANLLPLGLPPSAHEPSRRLIRESGMGYTNGETEEGELVITVEQASQWYEIVEYAESPAGSDREPSARFILMEQAATIDGPRGHTETGFLSQGYSPDLSDLQTVDDGQAIQARALLRALSSLSE